jgi:hypothetical protein
MSNGEGNPNAQVMNAMTSIISSFRLRASRRGKSFVICNQRHILSARRLKRRRSARLIPSAGIESASEVAKIDN